jgi:hypothetical protein
MADKIEELKKIKELLDQGIISEAEFKKLKSKITGVKEKEAEPKSEKSDQEKLDDLLKSNSITQEEYDKLKGETPPTKLKENPEISTDKSEKSTTLKSKPAPSSDKKETAKVDVKSEEPKKKSNKTIIIVLIALAVIIGGYFIWDSYFNNGEEAADNTEEPGANTVYVLSGELNFRSDKNTSENSKIQTLYFGDRIELVGSAEAPVYDGDLKLVWQQAEWNGKSGWIAKAIDDVEVVGNIEKYEDYKALFANNYDTLTDYGKVKVWAYDAMINHLKDNDWLGTYTIRNDDEAIRKNGLKTILRYRNSLDEKDKDAPYDFIVLLESETDKIAIYLQADSDNSGHVAATVELPDHVQYLIKRRKGDEIFGSSYNGVTLIELDGTALGTADIDGAISGWFITGADHLGWEEERFVESPYALDILSLYEGRDFVPEYDYYAFIKNGAHANSSVFWDVYTTGQENTFGATQYVSGGFGMTNHREEYGEWKETRYVTKNLDKMKLIIDIDQQQLLLFIRDNSGNPITWYGCIEKYAVQEFIYYRNGDDEVFGC